MFETLFGSEMPLAAKFFIAFVVVLALIGLTAWLVRRFGANRLGGGARGRQPRLAVIDAATVDGRRRLVLIRRDNVEHLLMIGGPTDVVVEPNIVRATAGARDAAARAGARSTSAEPAARQARTAKAPGRCSRSSEPAPIAGAAPLPFVRHRGTVAAARAGCAGAPGRQPHRPRRRIVDAAQSARGRSPRAAQRTGAAAERRPWCRRPRAGSAGADRS